MARTALQISSSGITWVNNGALGDIKLLETTAPSTDGTSGQLYVKASDHLLYFKDSSGTESLIETSASGANTALSNLGTTAINAALLPASAAGLDFGSTAKPWKDLWFAGSSGTPASNQFKITGASTSGVRTITFPDASITVARTDAGQTFTGVQIMTSPKILTSIVDTNGNTEISMIATASAVNYVELTNAATGTAGPIIAAQGETNVDLKVQGKGTGKVHMKTGTYGDVTAYSPAGAGTATITCQTSNIHQINMPAGNAVIAISNDAVGQVLTIDIVQDSVGSRTVTWFSGIKWAGGSAPTLTTAANKIDSIVIRVVTAGSAYYGYVAGANI